MQPEHAGQYVCQQFSGSDSPVAAYGMETHAKRRFGQQMRIRFGLQSHKLRLRISRLQPVLHCRDARRGILRKKLGAEVNEWDVAPVLHILESGDQMPGLQVVRTQAEDRGGEFWQFFNRWNTSVTNLVGVFTCFE